MGKLSALPTNSNPSLADFLIMIQSSSTTDQKATIASLLPAIFGGQVQTYTPTYNSISGGTVNTTSGWYLNLGGFKLCWGFVGISYTGGNTGVHVNNVSVPASFFTGTDILLLSVQGEGGNANQHVSGDSFNTGNSFNFYTDGGGGVGTGGIVSYLIIGN